MNIHMDIQSSQIVKVNVLILSQHNIFFFINNGVFSLNDTLIIETKNEKTLGKRRGYQMSETCLINNTIHFRQLNFIRNSKKRYQDVYQLLKTVISASMNINSPKSFSSKHKALNSEVAFVEKLMKARWWPQQLTSGGGLCLLPSLRAVPSFLSGKMC